MNILEINNVVKQYHKHTALKGVSFNVGKGKIFGLLGPNGAGKTSLIRIITTITGSDEGEVILDGEKLNNSHPEVIGYMPEERGLYKQMKVGEQLIYLGRLKGMSNEEVRKEIKYWFEKFQIQDWWNKKIEELSKGMQQKVQFIATVIHKPKLLILDEPFSGLDPVSSNLIKDEIRLLNEQGVSIIFSTHRMEQVEEICEDIVLINHGEIVLQGSVSNIKESFKENKYKIKVDALPENINWPQGFLVIESNQNEVVFKAEGHHTGNEMLANLIRQNVEIRYYNEVLPSLNEIFIRQVQESPFQS
jgi:ABC-2 type transport system ATP-binding protein